MLYENNLKNVRNYSIPEVLNNKNIFELGN